MVGAPLRAAATPQHLLYLFLASITPRTMFSTTKDSVLVLRPVCEERNDPDWQTFLATTPLVCHLLLVGGDGGVVVQENQVLHPCGQENVLLASSSSRDVTLLDCRLGEWSVAAASSGVPPKASSSRDEWVFALDTSAAYTHFVKQQSAAVVYDPSLELLAISRLLMILIGTGILLLLGIVWSWYILLYRTPPKSSGRSSRMAGMSPLTDLGKRAGSTRVYIDASSPSPRFVDHKALASSPHRRMNELATPLRLVSPLPCEDAAEKEEDELAFLRHYWG